MSNSSPRPNDKLPTGWLPNEVLSSIIEFFVIQSETARLKEYSRTADLHPSSSRQLLSLRLVCKQWAGAVTPISFRTIHLEAPGNVTSILENCRTLICDPNVSCPVKRLALERLSYWNVPYYEISDEEDPPYGPDYYQSIMPNLPPILMHQAAKVIQFLGENLTELNLTFGNSMGFPPAMVESVKQIKGLKRLTLDKEGHIPNKKNNNNFRSSSDLLNATPNLVSLVMNLGHLELKLKPQALSKLRYLWFSYAPTNVEGISHLCQTTKNNLKVIEYSAMIEHAKIRIVIEPMKDTLEGLYTHRIPGGLPSSITGMSLPKLRVVRGRFWRIPGHIPDLGWLQWPILQTVRTLVLDLYDSQDYWGTVFEQIGRNQLQKPPNLKHFIFITHQPFKKLEEAVSRTFRCHGIECHFLPEVGPDQILEFDYKLNGPM